MPKERSESAKRPRSFWKSDIPLTSERVRNILSHPAAAASLAKTVRQHQNVPVNGNGSASNGQNGIATNGKGALLEDVVTRLLTD